VHPLGVLDWQRALLLEHDPVVVPFLDLLSCLTSVPVGSERRAAGADQVVLKALAARGRQLRYQAGEVVARGEAVADEEYLQRAAASNTVDHVVLRFPVAYALSKTASTAKSSLPPCSRGEIDTAPQAGGQGR